MTVVQGEVRRVGAAEVAGLERRLTARLVDEHLAGLLPDVRTAVEIGPASNPLLPRLDGSFRAIAVDLEVSEHARPRFDEWHLGRAEALPLPDASADLVVARWVLEHVEDGRRALAEIARVLRPGGSFAFLTPNRLHPVFLANLCLQRALPFPVAQRVVELLTRRERDGIYRAWYRLSTRRTLERGWRPYGSAHVDAVDGATYGVDLSPLVRGPLAGCKPFLLGRLERGGAA